MPAQRTGGGKAMAIHLLLYSNATACKRDTSSVAYTNDAQHVTCKKCLVKLKRSGLRA